MEKRIQQTRPGGMTHNEKIRSWNAIEQRLTPQARPFSYVLFFKKTQSKVVAALLGLLILSGGAATAYADNAKPGDLLFPVEVAKEKAQILLTRDVKKKEALRVTFAQKRLAEVRELATLAEDTNESNESLPEDRIVIPEATSTSVSTSTFQAAVATKTQAKRSPKKARDLERVKRGKEVALREVRATRKLLEEDADEEAKTAVDRVITELNTVSVREDRRSGRGERGRNDVWRRAGATTSVGKGAERQSATSTKKREVVERKKPGNMQNSSTRGDRRDTMKEASGHRATTTEEAVVHSKPEPEHKEELEQQHETQGTSTSTEHSSDD